jgi:hypothetical protein
LENKNPRSSLAGIFISHSRINNPPPHETQRSFSRCKEAGIQIRISYATFCCNVLRMQLSFVVKMAICYKTASLDSGFRRNDGALSWSLEGSVFTAKRPPPSLRGSVFYDRSNPVVLMSWLASSHTTLLAMTMSLLYGLRPYRTNPLLEVLPPLVIFSNFQKLIYNYSWKRYASGY